VNRPPGTAEVFCGVNYSTLASKPIYSFSSFREINGKVFAGDKAELIARVSLKE